MTRLSLFFFLFVLFTSCSSEEKTASPKKAAVGEISELIIVGSESQLTGLMGDTVVSFFQTPFPLIPQAEASFDARFVLDRNFGEYEQGQANIILFSVGDKEQNRQGRVTQTVDKYAKGQKIYTIYAKNQRAFFDVFNENKEAILQDLNERATARSIVQVRYANNLALSDKVRKKFGFDIAIPEGFYLATEKENVLSFKRQRERKIQYRNNNNSVKGHGIVDGIVIYSYDHKSDSTFTLEKQIEIRDEVLGQTVLSPNDSPMRTEDDIRFAPIMESRDHNGVFASKLRGLWRFDSPIRGGPFVSLSFFLEKENNMIGIDGYVFAPNFKKRDYIREMEGIIHSAEIPLSEPTAK